MLKLLGKTILQGIRMSMHHCDGIVPKTIYEVSDDWYGGMVKKFGKIKGSNFLMCLDKRDNVLDIAYLEEQLTNEEKKSIGLIVEETETKTETVLPDIEPGTKKASARKK